MRAGEADVFHTRQQHTLKVAQVGRRLAELLNERQRGESRILNVDPEVVAAASLAHDLGHPPFGHIGEQTLNSLVLHYGDPDGYEGNAQTFRIVTKLAVRFDECPGLDLCRATLAACIKYPWFRNPADPNQTKKWGAYRSEDDDFKFALTSLEPNIRSTESELMDWADDIAYSVHDLEDFHRCGAIPWKRILDGDYTEKLVEGACQSWFDAPPDAAGRLREAMRRLVVFFEQRLYRALIYETYEGTRDQRQQLRMMTSKLIGRYIKAIILRIPDDSDKKSVHISSLELDEVKILKEITRHFIINNPTLVAQQRGQDQIIRSLFKALYEGISPNGPPKFLPRRLEYLWDHKVTNEVAPENWTGC